MQEIRGPGHPVPDSVPEELVAVYGAEAREAVRSRRSWRYRQGRRMARFVQGRDLWYLSAAGLLWSLIGAAFGASVVLAAIRWPLQTLYGGALAATAIVSSALTALWVRGRRIREAR